MNFLLIGVNHTTAPLEVREQLAIPESHLPEAMRRLAEYPGVEEAMILSTCNRVELLANCEPGTDLRGFLRDYLQVDPARYANCLYEYREREAIRHLFRVAASLDSMVLGEPQILGQVKEAYAMARAVGALRTHLDALVSRSFAVAKKVRSETEVGSSAVSVASVAVELAKKIFGSLEGRVVYLVGAGKMCELAAHLRARPAAGPQVQRPGHALRAALRDRRSGRHRSDLDRRPLRHLPPRARRALHGAAQEPAHVLH
jgi:glutamyl-tRNA reductase